MKIRARPLRSYFCENNRKRVRKMKKMEQANYIKAAVATVFGFLTSLIGVLALPVVLVVVCNLIDYITGLMASPYRNQDINSYKSIRGIMKKICMWLLIVVGAIIDQMLIYASDIDVYKRQNLARHRMLQQMLLKPQHQKCLACPQYWADLIPQERSLRLY